MAEGRVGNKNAVATSCLAVSLGWVSALRQQLLAREWAVEEPGGLQVAQPAQPSEVLEAWTKADDWGKRIRTHESSVLQPDPLELATKVRDLLPGEAPIFTQWLAGWLRHPYTTPALVTAYVRRFPDVALPRENLLARRVPSGGTLRLVVPKDEGVWNPSQTVNGFELVSDVQIYLDLAHAGLRADVPKQENCGAGRILQEGGHEQIRNLRRLLGFH